MSMKHPVMPKGRACRLDLTPEYEEGRLSNKEDVNPYDFFGDWDEYERHYAWDIGSQKRDR
jgi:hypothetical protein